MARVREAYTQAIATHQDVRYRLKRRMYVGQEDIDVVHQHKERLKEAIEVPMAEGKESAIIIMIVTIIIIGASCTRILDTSVFARAETTGRPMDTLMVRKAERTLESIKEGVDSLIIELNQAELFQAEYTAPVPAALLDAIQSKFLDIFAEYPHGKYLIRYSAEITRKYCLARTSRVREAYTQAIATYQDVRYQLRRRVYVGQEDMDLLYQHKERLREAIEVPMAEGKESAIIIMIVTIIIIGASCTRILDTSVFARAETTGRPMDTLMVRKAERTLESIKEGVDSLIIELNQAELFQAEYTAPVPAALLDAIQSKFLDIFAEYPHGKYLIRYSAEITRKYCLARTSRVREAYTQAIATYQDVRYQLRRRVYVGQEDMDLLYQHKERLREAIEVPMAEHCYTPPSSGNTRCVWKRRQPSLRHEGAVQLIEKYYMIPRIRTIPSRALEMNRTHSTRLAPPVQNRHTTLFQRPSAFPYEEGRLRTRLSGTAAMRRDNTRGV
ncbi:hypothetical protein HPB50_003461 [Hyalomma asiaticum]|uniref:Uncharacterized protein n=1 Tax=Hyalomma asiaticum TaxID=266040 RepID=A0ACB7S0J5_HYAAI|nr:hypothetical protein HPB50_003461 [Hyalomma asiaticum]